MDAFLYSSSGSSNKPSVSFIMGVYCCKNPEALRASVESVINQTFVDWELIIVDDGSPDDGATFSAIVSAASLDERVVALRYGENKGLSYALNFCLEHAQGRYIARQDDDDLSMPTRLERQINLLESDQNISIVGSNAMLFDDDGEWGALEMPENPTCRSFLWNSPFIHPSVVMRADALRSVGGYRVSPETMRGQDYDLFMRMYARGMLGKNIPDQLYRYRSDRKVSKYRPMSRRVQEAKVRAKGFKGMGLGLSRYPYIAKPILLGLVPKRVYGFMQKERTAL